MIGLGSPTGNGSDAFDPGLVLGLSLGARLSPLLSLEALLEYDRLNPDGGSSGFDVTAYVARIVVSPSFHFVRDNVDLSVGPTLGLFLLSSSFDSPFGEASASVRGTQLGARIMAMFGVSPSFSIGPLFAYERMWASKFCLEDVGENEICDGSPENDDEGFWRLALAARF